MSRKDSRARVAQRSHDTTGIQKMRKAKMRTGLFHCISFLLLLVGVPAAAQWTTSGADIQNTNTGSVGIGGAPHSSFKLKVTGKLYVTDEPQFDAFRVFLRHPDAQIRFGQSTADGRWSLGIAADTTDDFILYDYARNEIPLRFVAATNVASFGGSVGIGTALPATKLHVVGDTTITGNIGIVTSTPPIARLQVGTMISDNIESVSLSGDVRLPAYTNGIAYLQARDSSGNRSIGLQLRTQLAGAPVEAVKIGANGNLGIGTVDPTARLDVNGNVNVTGNITVSGNVNAKYQDVAEWVPSTQRLRPGNVVVFDRHNNNSVLAASVAYDTGVAGVVSPQPGVLLGEAGPEKLKVATTGRVRVRVDATIHPILIGDLLVTSNKTGAAMSEAVTVSGIEMHRPGTILGKALEPLEAGEGEILVLLSLQ